MTPLRLPHATGLPALTELDLVPWQQLAHAYGVGVTGLGIAHDVKGALRHLAQSPAQALRNGLNSNIFHRGTVYEATAYAVPFIAAVIAGPIERGVRVQLALLLAHIARSASYEARAASQPGAWGAGVGPLINEAFRTSSGYLRAAAMQADLRLAEVLHAVVAATEAPSIELTAFLDDTVERFEDALGLHD